MTDKRFSELPLAQAVNDADMLAVTQKIGEVLQSRRLPIASLREALVPPADPDEGRSGLSGAASGLVITTTGTSAPISIAADEVCIKTADGKQKVVKNLALTLSLNKSGVNGLDTGVLLRWTWYAVHIISNGNNVAALGSLNAKSPALPVGYTYSGRVGWVLIDGYLNPMPMTQRGKSVRYKIQGGDLFPMIAWGQQTKLMAARVSQYVPPTAKAVVLVGGTTSGTMGFAANDKYESSFSFGIGHGRDIPFVAMNNSDTGQSVAVVGSIVLESDCVYYASTTTGASLCIMGWEDN